MSIHEPIIIRKMNHKALSGFGYNNAFVYFAKFFNFIPLSSKPFFFVSDGFFEDLSPEEQLFLIGHELVHAKHRHLLYDQFIFLLIFLILLFFAFLQVGRFINYLVRIYSFKNYEKYLAIVLYILVFVSLNLCIKVTFCCYRKQQEWQADQESLALLKSYNGGIKFFERCVREYRQDWHSGGIFVDHPSNYERRMYCLTAQQNESLNKSIG
jgi:Zn-dependent protease with chaperone function